MEAVHFSLSVFQRFSFCLFDFCLHPLNCLLIFHRSKLRKQRTALASLALLSSLPSVQTQSFSPFLLSSSELLCFSLSDFQRFSFCLFDFCLPLFPSGHAAALGRLAAIHQNQCATDRDSYCETPTNEPNAEKLKF